MSNQAVIKMVEENEILKQRVCLLENWIQILEKDISIGDFLRRNNIFEVAIYAYGKYGKMLMQELKKDGILVKYAIDANKTNEMSDIPIFLLHDKLPAIDMVIVSTVGISVLDIRESLAHLGCPVIGLNELVKGLVN